MYDMSWVSNNNGPFTPSERESESDIANIWIVLFPIQLFTPSDAKDQRKNRFRFLRSLGVNGPLGRKEGGFCAA